MISFPPMFSVAAPVKIPARIIAFRPSRQIGKAESLRRERLAARLMMAARRAQNPAIRAIWEAKARACGFWPSSYLKAEPPVVILAPSEYVLPAKSFPWISLTLWLTLAVALT